MGSLLHHEQLYIKVNTDLAVAHDLFQRIQKRPPRPTWSAWAILYAFRDAVRNKDRQTMRGLVERERQGSSFSFLRVVPAGFSGVPQMSQPGVGIEILDAAGLACTRFQILPHRYSFHW